MGADANEKQVEVAADGFVVDKEMSDEPTPTGGRAPRMAPDHPQYAVEPAHAVKDVEGLESDGSGMILKYMGDKVFLPLREESHRKFVELHGLQAFVHLEWDQQEFSKANIFEFLGSWNEQSESGVL